MKEFNYKDTIVNHVKFKILDMNTRYIRNTN